MKEVLITGGSGLLGGSLIRVLSRKWHHIVICDTKYVLVYAI